MKNALQDITESSNTKDKIMLEAAVLFAHYGYAAVSVRDIADKVNIRASSIYNHFSSKEVLFNDILENIKNVYLNFYDRTETQMKKARSFEEVLDCLFAELKDVYRIFIYYGFSLINTEQFRDEKANEVFNETLIKIGIDYAKKKFDECIEKNWVKSFDTKTMATLFMNSVFVGTLMRAHDAMGQKTAYDATEMFNSLQKFMLNSVEVIN